MSVRKKKTRLVKVGDVAIGGGSPIPVQSMANIKTSNKKRLVKQIRSLFAAGCEIIRVSVLDKKDAVAIADIKREINIPLCADIHFDYNLALLAIDAGADKVRINPGNIGDENKVREVTLFAKKKKVAIRVGANSGSLDRTRYKNKSLGLNLARSAMDTVKFIESLGFKNIVVSAKAHSVTETLTAYRELSSKINYPLHLGVTASGGGVYSIIKSSVGIGSLLAEGIGDTIRVSYTGNPVEEIKIGREILQALGLADRDLEVIACPTCGRTEIDVIRLAKDVENFILKSGITLPHKPYRIAVMGCVVNGPGEAKGADIAITGGRKFGFIMKEGRVVKKVDEKFLFEELLKVMRS